MPRIRSFKLGFIYETINDEDDNAHTKEMASLADAIRGPAKIEWKLEKLAPVIRGEREGFSADECGN